MFGWGGDPHFGPFHIASYIVIFAGFVLLARSRGILYEAQRRGELAASGPYAWVRHPQYAGFIAIMTRFFLQQPDASEARHVPGARLHVRPARTPRGARRHCAIRP